jgi:hypothetical protein
MSGEACMPTYKKPSSPFSNKKMPSWSKFSLDNGTTFGSIAPPNSSWEHHTCQSLVRGYTRQALACLSHRKVIHPGERNETDYNKKNLVTEQKPTSIGMQIQESLAAMPRQHNEGYFSDVEK